MTGLGALIVCVGIVGALVAFSSNSHREAQGTRRSFSADGMPTCGSQLGIIGFSVETVKGYSGEGKPEFSELTASHFKLGIDLNTVMFIAAGPEAPSQTLARLHSQPHVLQADVVYALSSDPTYLSCDYKLRDNPTDQGLASKAKQALIGAGADASILGNAGTMEYVSLRHLGKKEFLQVAFVYLPVDGPHVSYAALLDKSTEAVVWAGQTHWYS
jgi:hypothetical protein